jgi:branched-chain amino acid aminotransferase
MSPRVKTHNYINLILGQLEVKEQDSEVWAPLLDEDGNLAEGKGCNVFVVKNWVVATPKN